MKFILLLLFPVLANAQVLSVSGKELRYSYTAEFLMEGAAKDAGKQALRHAYHMYGIFQSPTIVYDIGLDPEIVDGIAAPRTDMRISVRSVSRDLESGLLRVQYSNQGKILFHKAAAKKILRKGAFVVQLPANMSDYYDPKCADKDFYDLEYFWYFFDPYKEGCDHLVTAPLAKKVIVQVREQNPVDPKTTPRLDLLRGNNGNGDLLSVYVVHGYSENESSTDDGRINFEQLNDYLREQGFEEKVLNRTQNRPLHLFTKSVTLDNGQEMQIEVKHQLADTELDIRGITFAKFFKEAVETADVVIYAGHSGLGSNLDIAGLERKVGNFRFNPKKKQIFFFDACTSYAFHLSPFAAEKTRGKIDILTYALPSYFHTGQAVKEKFFEILFDPSIQDMTWLNIMKAMEEPLDGGTYLLNVGGF